MIKLNVYITEAWGGIKKHTNNVEIESWCDEVGIKNYTINSQGEIDVDGDVILRRSDLKELPYKFGRVSGDFNISYNRNIKSFKNCPHFVGDSFLCSYCPQLESLEGCPKVIRQFFICEECNKVKFSREDISSLCKIKMYNIFI